MTSETKRVALAEFGPTNSLVKATLTDLYQITMLYGDWFMGRQEIPATFDLFIRRNPFGGEFTIFAGLDEVLRFVKSYHFTEEEISYLRTKLPNAEPQFFNWLRTLDCSGVKMYAQSGVVFPKVPFIRIDAPLGVGKLLETTLLNLINYPSLVATNAMRFRLAAGKNKTLLEFGLRRSQGPDGGISASKYSYLGGFDGTSNVLASAIAGISCYGTHAHSWVLSFTGFNDIPVSRKLLQNKNSGNLEDFIFCVKKWRKELGYEHTNEGELAAFTAYALAFPDKYLALVDTYDTLKSGIPNFLCAALALFEFGYTPLGIRLDSGDLGYLSKMARSIFADISVKTGFGGIRTVKISASNDIDEAVLHELNRQGHEIDTFGIGTNLVTCKTQPALGGVYKLVACASNTPIKLAEDKTTIPGKKEAFRLFNSVGEAVVDLMVLVGEETPKVGQRILCRHPFVETKRMFVTPSRVEKLHSLVWDGEKEVVLPSLQEQRSKILEVVYGLREDYTRAVNPTQYKVSVSEKLYLLLHKKMADEAPIEEIM